MKPNDEHIQEVLEWCGIRKGSEIMVGGSYGHGVYNWHYPDGWTTTELPDLNLVSVFKYIVPRLLKTYNVESYTFKQTNGLYYTEVNVWREGIRPLPPITSTLHATHVAKHFEQGFEPDKVATLAYFWAARHTIQEERRQQRREKQNDKV